MRILHLIRNNIYALVVLLFLCTFSYLLGVRQSPNPTSPFPVSLSLSTPTGNPDSTPALPCNYTTLPPDLPPIQSDFQVKDDATPLDFAPRHVADDAVLRPDGGGGGAHPELPPCDARYAEYTPCEDLKRSRRFPRARLARKERHCPEREEVLRCRVPAPYGYRKPFEWPASRDRAWYANVPHKHLTVAKAEQHWISYEGDTFSFPGGGTTFPNGADAYIDDIAALLDLRDGSIRTAVDTGCGVASWGAYLLSREILTMSFAPKDSHEAQVQFALERGVPAMLGILATLRLPYPSRAFDMAHCSRCLIPWNNYDGLYLMEVDRVLRPGGYWILAGPPINWKVRWRGWERTRADLSEEQSRLENLTSSLCWKKFIERDDIAIWQKPLNHLECEVEKKFGQKPPLCPQDQDPDKAWYTKMENCLTRLPDVSHTEEVAGGSLTKWPERLNAVPPRISMGTLEGVTDETFRTDIELWNKRVSHYKAVNSQLRQPGKYRNVLDMNAHLGGFAAALAGLPVWVMNVVPVQAKLNTLGVIYERGLIGAYQDWCEAMSTYPRTYDLIHVDSIFSLYQDRCDMEDILLEMDRVLRPEGSVICRDDVDILVKIKKIADALKWESRIVDHEDGPYQREKLLFAAKTYWTSPAPPQQNGTTS